MALQDRIGIFLQQRGWLIARWLLLVGALLRIAIWLQNRSLFIDECNLARNFCEKSYSGLWGNLDYAQYAPPVFCSLEKAIIDAFGMYEMALRAVPLLFGLVGLYVFYRLSTYWLRPVGGILAACFMGFAPLFLKFSTEVKQYASDVTLALLVVYLAQNERVLRDNRAFLTLLLIGSIGIWSSMPLIFVLAGIGCFWAWQLYRQGAGAALWAKLILMSSIWIGNFLLYYWLILANDVDTGHLQKTHTFFLFPPKSIAELSTMLGALMDFRTPLVGITFVSSVVFLSGVFGAIAAFYTRKRSDWILLVFPILFCLAASALHKYALADRLILFLLPLLLLVLGVGWDYLFEKIKHPIAQVLFFLLVVVAAAGHCKPGYFFQPLHVEEHRSGLAYLQRYALPEDAVYIHPDVTDVALFYKEFSAQRIDLKSFIMPGAPSDDTFTDLLAKQHPARIWLLWDNSMPAPDMRIFEAAGFKSQRVLFYLGGSVYLLEK